MAKVPVDVTHKRLMQQNCIETLQSDRDRVVDYYYYYYYYYYGGTVKGCVHYSILSLRLFIINSGGQICDHDRMMDAGL